MVGLLLLSCCCYCITDVAIVAVFAAVVVYVAIVCTALLHLVVLHTALVAALVLPMLL